MSIVDFIDMIITRLISTAIDIQNVINVYTDLNNIKQIIIDKYEGKCYGGCFIKQVLRIVEIGECVINQIGMPTFGTVPVCFSAQVISYMVGEIINGCTVKNIDKAGFIICVTDIASITIVSKLLVDSVQVGQIISIRVGIAKYMPHADRVSVNATLYLPEKKTVIYKLGKLTPADKTLIVGIVERVKAEEALAAELKVSNSKAWQVFDTLLYVYKKKQEPPSGVKQVDITAPIGADIEFISRDPRHYRSTPVAYGYTSETTKPAGAEVRHDLTTANVMVILLEDYCSHLRTIREMVEIYSTEHDINRHRNIWQIMNRNKVDG